MVVSDGAEWIRSACGEIFGGRKVTFVLDMFHALEYAADAVRAILPAGAERDRRFAEVRADTGAGRAGKVVRELEPFSARHGEVAACCRYFRGTWSECATTNTGRGASRSEAGSWKADAGRSGRR